MSEARKRRVKKTMTREIKRASNPVEAKEIIDEIKREAEAQVVATNQERKPGLTIGGSKITYTYQDLVKMFPIVSFVPEETVGLTFQGIRVQAIAGFPMHVPECFKRIYDNHRAIMREKPNIPNIGYETKVEFGIGALPPREVE